LSALNIIDNKLKKKETNFSADTYSKLKHGIFFSAVMYKRGEGKKPQKCI
jgi:hypothetical protein